MGILVELIKLVLSFRRARKQCPAAARKQHRAHDFVKHVGLDLGVFVQHHAVGVGTAQGVGIIGPQQPDFGPVGQLQAQFGFGQFDIRQRRGKTFDIVPGNKFGLFQKRGNVKITRCGARIGQRAFKQMVDGADGFAHLAVRNEHAKAAAFQRGVNEVLRVAGLVRDNNGRVLFHSFSQRTTSGRGGCLGSSLPSLQPKIFLAVNTAKDAE